MGGDDGVDDVMMNLRANIQEIGFWNIRPNYFEDMSRNLIIFPQELVYMGNGMHTLQAVDLGKGLAKGLA